MGKQTKVDALFARKTRSLLRRVNTLENITDVFSVGLNRGIEPSFMFSPITTLNIVHLRSMNLLPVAPHRKELHGIVRDILQHISFQILLTGNSRMMSAAKTLNA
jgi:hypothetical protein